MALDNSLPPENLLAHGDVNTTCSLFKNAFLDNINKHVPSKTVSCWKPLPPWVNEAVRKVIHKRNIARRTARQSGSEADWAKYRKLRNTAVSSVKRAKKEFFMSLSYSPDSISNFWKTYNLAI